SDGAWAGALADDARISSENGQSLEYDGEWSLIHIAPDGTRVVQAERYGATLPSYGVIVSFEVEPTIDFDGDGHPEVLVTEDSTPPEGEGRTSRVISTLRRGRVEPYGPAAGFAIKRLEDVDHDGRPDIVFPIQEVN